MTDAIDRAERMIADALPDGADGPSGPALAAALRDSVEPAPQYLRCEPRDARGVFKAR